MKKYLLQMTTAIILCLTCQNSKLFAIDDERILWSDPSTSELHRVEEKLIFKFVNDPFCEKTIYLLSLIYLENYLFETNQLFYLKQFFSLTSHLKEINEKSAYIIILDRLLESNSITSDALLPENLEKKINHPASSIWQISLINLLSQMTFNTTKQNLKILTNLLLMKDSDHFIIFYKFIKNLEDKFQEDEKKIYFREIQKNFQKNIILKNEFESALNHINFLNQNYITLSGLDFESIYDLTQKDNYRASNEALLQLSQKLLFEKKYALLLKLCEKITKEQDHPYIAWILMSHILKKYYKNYKLSKEAFNNALLVNAFLDPLEIIAELEALNSYSYLNPSQVLPQFLTE